MRIFIDCSYVDFGRQPTGIPRVVLKYVEAGYAWGEKHGVDVVPVVTTEKGLFPVRPLPGENPPERTVGYVDPGRGVERHPKSAVAHLREAEDALTAALIGAGSPAAAPAVSKGVATLFAQLASGADEALQIGIRPGDIVFFPAYWHDIKPKHWEALQTAGAKVFILVHDILPITFAKFYHSPWRYHFADNLLEACEKADGLFAVSGYTARKVTEFAEENGLKPRPIEVMHNGFDPLVEDVGRRKAMDRDDYRPPMAKRETYRFFKEQQPYLMVGTIEPKKGHIPAIDMFERLWSQGLARPLVLVGRTGWMEEDVVRKIKSSPWFGDKLLWLDDLDDADLYWAYRHSRALVFASYAEGFGIPLIESAKAGLPSICLETEVAREVAGGHALFFSTGEQFAAHVMALEDDRRWRDEKRRLDGFKWPSWDDIGQRLFDRLSAAGKN